MPGDQQMEDLPAIGSQGYLPYCPVATHNEIYIQAVPTHNIQEGGWHIVCENECLVGQELA